MSADLKFSFQDNGESFLIHGHAYATLIVKIKTTWVFVVFLCWWFIVKIRTFGFTTKQCSMDNKITSVFHLKSTDLKYKWSCLYTSTSNKMSILNFTKIFFFAVVCVCWNVQYNGHKIWFYRTKKLKPEFSLYSTIFYKCMGTKTNQACYNKIRAGTICLVWNQ